MFSLVPHSYYKLNKADTTKNENKFGLYNPIINVKNSEASIKNNTMMNFLEGVSFILQPQITIGISQINKILSILSTFINNTPIEEISANLRFALLMLFKRLYLLLFNLDSNKFYFTHEDLISSYSFDQLSSEQVTILTNTNQSYDLFTKCLFVQLCRIFNKNQLVENMIKLSIDFLSQKIDSDNQEVLSFFVFLSKYHTSLIDKLSSERNFDFKSFIEEEKLSISFKYPECLMSEEVHSNKLGDINDGFLNSFYLPAATNKEFLIYTTPNSLFHLSSTITYYDGLIHLFKYNQNGASEAERFIELSKDQKIDSDFTPFEINIFSYKREIYKIIFENYFSWINGKEYKYKLSNIKISKNLPKSEIHKQEIKYKIDNFKEAILTKITEFIFNKFEIFLGKTLDKYSKKTLAFNNIAPIEHFLVDTVIKQANKEKEKDLRKKLNLSNKSDLSEDQIISKAKTKYDLFFNSLSKGKRAFRADRLQSIDVIIKNYIKNVFVRINMNEKELDDQVFIDEMKKLEDLNDQFLFINYFYLKQNSEFSLGDYFEKATKNNSNVIFMKFSLVESALVYFLYTSLIEEEKIPERAIYLHFDNSIDKFAYSFYSEGDIITESSTFTDESKNQPFEVIVKKIIDCVNFKEKFLPKEEKKKEDDSDSEESSDDEEERETKLKKWKIVCSFTGNLENEGKSIVKSKIKELNLQYLKDGKTSKTKRIKPVFKNVSFIEEMTSFMHCFEIY